MLWLWILIDGVDFHFSSEKIEIKEIKLKYVHTNEQSIDFLIQAVMRRKLLDALSTWAFPLA